MNYEYEQVANAREILLGRFNELQNKSEILKAVELRALYGEIKTLQPEQRGSFGKEVNSLKLELEALVENSQEAAEALPPIDVTAPFAANTPISERPAFLPTNKGSQHPLAQEIEKLSDIFARMGFKTYESREIDTEFFMFTSLNFPAGHPARDEYDTFLTKQTDPNSNKYVAPAHTSVMQHRILKEQAPLLDQGEAIAAIVPDRVFRNEDLDARHEHTFYQFEGIFVDKGVHAGMLIATLKAFLQEYYGKMLEVRINPFYFPFTEPSFELSLSCPFCDKAGCSICSQAGWIELIGCGMIHPNVLRQAGISPEVYTGFAWGCGIERLVMMKHSIEDVRHFESAKLDFLRQF